jgi:hypothetical protein
MSGKGAVMKLGRRLLLVAALAVAGCSSSSAPTQPPPPGDAYEPNDFAPHFVGTLSSTDIVLHGTTSSGSDVDLFSVTATGTVNLYASVDWSVANDLELTLSNANGIFVRHVDTGGHPESCTLNGLPAGTYTIRVGSLTDAATDYTLTIGQR